MIQTLKKIGLLCITAALMLLHSGCAFNPFEAKPSAPAQRRIVAAIVPATPTQLTDEAIQLLLVAENKISEARGAHALWTSALETFSQARQAANIFNSEKTMQLARETIALCELSLAQTKSPPVSW